MITELISTIQEQKEPNGLQQHLGPLELQGVKTDVC